MINDREEAIQRIVWALLAHADKPKDAVGLALTLKGGLGQNSQRDFHNLLRSAGLFARDEDAFFVRYLENPNRVDESSFQLPAATHLLTIAVPVEPRMRIAYNVFAGLLLKHLYRQHGAVPTFVTEGLAMLWTPSRIASDPTQVWKDFQSSELAKKALTDGVQGTFSALRRGRPIGAIEVPSTWKGTYIEDIIRAAVEQNPKSFQGQAKKDKLQFNKAPKNAISEIPINLYPLGSRHTQAIGASVVTSSQRCLICGATGEMIQGGKFFLPENKKQWYEEPGPRDKFPRICSTCAFVALLSGVTPSRGVCIVEFPVDNYVDLFALYGYLQGLSSAIALKTITRVSSLSIFPSKYLLLSQNTSDGRMDSKTQVYVQLRKHSHLFSNDRSLRVQLEGSQPNFSSEIYPHVIVGLSHFAHMPEYYESKNRKITAQDITRALVEGRPFYALYVAVGAQQKDGTTDRVWERGVLAKGLAGYETEFVRNKQYALAMMRYLLGGNNMDTNLYDDVISFSNYLINICQPLIKREVQSSKSSVSGIARKYTGLIEKDFKECRPANFLYVACQRADQAEKKDAWWVKRELFGLLYPSSKNDEKISSTQKRLDEAEEVYDATQEELKKTTDSKRLTIEEALKVAEAKLDEALAVVRDAWDSFRKNNPRTELESSLFSLHGKYEKDNVAWSKFLREVEYRTLALLLLNVHRSY